MHEELVKRLKDKAGRFDYDGWVDTAAIIEEAADAIEELNKDLERSKEWESFWEKEANEALKKFQTTVANVPHWIPVTETNKPKAREPVMVVYVGWNDGLLHRDCTAYWSEDEDTWRWAETDDKVKVLITHYMPLPSLPEPPKEEA